MTRRPPHPFWRYSLRVYRAPGVQDACLALQDRCGADVNLLLFCGWLGQAGRALDRRRLRQAMARVGAWQSGVVVPVRQARRALRHHPWEGPAAALAPPLRQRMLAMELELEYVEQCILVDLAAQWPPPAHRVAPRLAAAASLTRYLALLGPLALEAGAPHVAVLSDACTSGVVAVPAVSRSRAGRR